MNTITIQGKQFLASMIEAKKIEKEGVYCTFHNEYSLSSDCGRWVLISSDEGVTLLRRYKSFHFNKYYELVKVRDYSSYVGGVYPSFEEGIEIVAHCDSLKEAEHLLLMDAIT